MPVTEAMKAAVMHGLRDVRIDRVAAPTITADDDVIINVKCCGVCGSDVHYFEHGRIGNFVVTGPLILGHECAGVVAEVGSGVNKLCVGDRVAIEPGVPCRRCEHCRQGRYNLCPDVVFYATPPVDGAFAEYVKSPADFCYKLPDNVTLDEAAMIEPLSTGLAAMKRGGTKPGDTVVVVGTGPIGLVTVQAARAYGAANIIAADLVSRRLEIAAGLGATHTVNVAAQSLEEAVRDITGGRGADIAIETAGAVQATQVCFEVTKPGGVVVLVGMAMETHIPVNTMAAIVKELDVRGVFRYANLHPQAVALLAAGKFDLESLITHHYDLDHTADALAFAAGDKETAIKVMVHN